MTDIADLFARDPEKLTKTDLAELVAYYRSAREQYLAGAKQAGNPKKLKNGTLKITDLKNLDLDL